MDSLKELALTADVAGAATAAVHAGVAEAQRQASRIVGIAGAIEGPTPDSGPADSGPADSGPADTDPADTDPADTDPADPGHAPGAPTNPAPVDAAQQLAWQLACLRIELAAGWEPIETVVSLRRFGATWAVIGAAAGMTRQSAHERWHAPTLAVLDRYGSGELGGPVADEEPVG